MSEPVSLKARIEADMKDSMRNREKERLGIIRLILAAIKQREVDERITLDDTQVISVLEKMLKQRRDSIEQFRNANRIDLAQAEEYEVSVIQSYLPTPLSEGELDQLVASAVAETGASSIKDMGKVMALLKSKVQGRADMGAVSAKIKAKLGS